MKNYIVLIFILLLPFLVAGQPKQVKKKANTVAKAGTKTATGEKASPLTNSLKMIAGISNASVKLRWALEKPLGWKDCNRYGFRVVRFTVKRDTSWLAEPEKMVLAEAWKAKPEASWEQLAKRDDYAAILAQTIYGKQMDVDIDMKDKSPLTAVVNEHQDLQQRYSLSILACDMSFEAAKMGGWGFEDSLVKKNERYLYRVIPLASNTQVSIDSAMALVTPADYKALPKTGKPQVVFGDSLATIGYNYFLQRETYVAFHIERSDDKGKSWKRLTQSPVTGVNEKRNQQSYQFYYTDRLENNTTEYSYRLCSVNSFSETGPFSESVKGKGISRISAYPHITACFLNEKGYAEITWEFDAENEKGTQAFQLEHSKTNGGPYKIWQANISAKERRLTVKKLENANYFMITAIGKNGDKHASPKRFLQLEDSVPPAPPELITAKADSLGNVRLEWKANKEEDLLGYKVYRANNEKEEPYPVTDTVYKKTVLEQKLSASMGNRKIYYYVVAIDKRYNQSDFSKRIEVERPDITPPTSPIFTSYVVTKQGVKLTWGICQDEDVESHVLLRKGSTAVKWEEVARFKDTTSVYSDKQAEPGKTYYYAIVARDRSGLVSPVLKPVKVSLPGDPSKLRVNNFRVMPDLDGINIELLWDSENSNIATFELYKGEGEEPVTLWKIVQGGQRKIKDIVTPGMPYKYQIRAVMPDGTIGIFNQLNF